MKRWEILCVVFGVSRVGYHPYNGAFQRGPLQQPALHELHVPRGVHADPHRRAR